MRATRPSGSLRKRPPFALVVSTAAAVAVVVSPVARSAGVPAWPAHSTLRASSAPDVSDFAAASGDVSAHDGGFWIGSTRTVFHGVNHVPGNLHLQQDLDRMATWGMNLLRLRVRWASLEPIAPVDNGDGTWTHTFDSQYTQQVVQTIQGATADGIYVDVSFHDCNADVDDSCQSDFPYPYWLYEAPYNSHGITYASTADGETQAAGDFWTDALRQQFMTDAWKYVVTTVTGLQGVASFEVMNEPDMGYMQIDHIATQTSLDFQLKVAKVIRSLDPSRTIVFTTRSGYGAGLTHADLTGFAALGNVAFDVHDYGGARWGNGFSVDTAGVTTGEKLQTLMDSVNIKGSPPPPPYVGTVYGHERYFQSIINLLAPWGIPLLVGEMGDIHEDPGIYNYYGTTMAAMDDLGVSWTTVYDGRLGITDGADGLLPWAQLVIDAV